MRKRLRLLLPLLGGCFILYTIFWFWTASRLRAEIDANEAALAARAIGIESAWGAAEGFPFAVRIATPRWRLETSAGLRWQGAGLSVRVRPWQPLTAEMRLVGRHRITAAPGEARRIALELEGATMRVQPVAETLALDIRSLAYAENDAPPLIVEEVGVEAAVTGGLPAAATREALLAWVTGGARIEIDDARGRFEETRFAARGWLGLDQSLRPLGRADLEVRNHGAALRTLAARGFLDAENLPMVEIGLAWLSVPDAETGAAVLKLPLVAEGGTLSLGPVTLAALEPLL